MTESLTIVIPSYNEEASLKSFLPKVIEFCSFENYNLIVVNDGSLDNTNEILSDFSDNKFNFVNHKVNKGYGAAIKSGVKLTSTEFVITIDADGQHLLSDVKKLHNLIIQTNSDMIVGARPNEKNAYYRNLGKYIIRKFSKTLLPNNITDINSGMKIYKTEIAKKYLHLCPDGMSYSDTILLLFINFKHLVTEQKINLNKRMVGKSTINTLTAMETLIQILNIAVLFKPIKVFSFMSIIILLASLIWGLPILLDGRGLSIGTLMGIMISVFTFFLGLIVEQITQIRKNVD